VAAHICVFRAFKPKVASKAIQDEMGPYTRLVVRCKAVAMEELNDRTSVFEICFE
jgi:hypothetical protein